MKNKISHLTCAEIEERLVIIRDILSGACHEYDDNKTYIYNRSPLVKQYLWDFAEELIDIIDNGVE